jgi:signal transduction histidine kinase
VSSTRLVALEAIQKFFLAYVGFNLVVAGIYLFMSRFPLVIMQWVTFISGLLDALLVAALTLITNGFDSMLYWFFPGLILRNAMSIPLAPQQLIMNLGLCICYFLAGVLDVSIEQYESFGGFDETTVRNLGFGLPESPTEHFLLRIMVLLFMTFVCYMLQVLFERQRVDTEEKQEFSLRQEQVNAAGRLAAEVAHQIKNPLSIINNASYNLQRLVGEEKPLLKQQVNIIREEIERADRIMTDLIGYAKLTEVRIERLDLAEELERCIGQVFPSDTNYPVEIVRDFEPGLPPLMMQRGHLSEVVVNILQNAREAMDGKGTLSISVRQEPGKVVVIISDTGPGIPPERLERVFEPYFTTKPKGSGLGLSIVRHCLDVYGGHARAESSPGAGARFILEFPAKTSQTTPV